MQRYVTFLFVSVGTLGIVVVGLVVVAAFLFFAKRAGWVRLDIFGGKLAGGTKGAGASIRDAVSRKGNIRANDETGAGANIERVDAHGDIQAESKSSDPKQ